MNIIKFDQCNNFNSDPSIEKLNQEISGNVFSNVIKIPDPQYENFNIIKCETEDFLITIVNKKYTPDTPKLRRSESIDKIRDLYYVQYNGDIVSNGCATYDLAYKYLQEYRKNILLNKES